MKEYLRLARPRQWLKNLFVLSPLFFAARFTDISSLINGFWAFFAFCLCSSGVYAINDILDVENDREHPQKKFRPLAAGRMSRRKALFFAIVVLCLAFLSAFLFVSQPFFVILLSYLLLNLAYSWQLKHIVLIDICCIGIGFVLRVFAGGAAVGVTVSHWIVLMTFLLSLFLALAKRRDDVLLQESGKVSIRYTTRYYNKEFISSAMVLMASVTVVCYVMYSVSPTVVALHHSDKLYLTGFWVLLGFLRYMQLTFVEEKSGSPTLIFFHDRFLQLVITFWIISFSIILYG